MVSYSIPAVMRLLKPTNESETMVNMFEFGLVPKNHYYYNLMFGYLIASIGTHEIVVGDTLFLITLEHASGVFKIIG